MRLLVRFACYFLASGCLIFTAAQAQISGTLHADLKTSQTAAVAGTGSGSAVFTYDQPSHQLTWRLTYMGLSSDPVAVHIHGPANPGVANSIIVVDLGRGSASGVMQGSATLDDTQSADLLGGRDYVDIHTQLNENGELRGAILP